MVLIAYQSTRRPMLILRRDTLRRLASPAAWQRRLTPAHPWLNSDMARGSEDG